MCFWARRWQRGRTSMYSKGRRSCLKPNRCSALRHQQRRCLERITGEPGRAGADCRRWRRRYMGCHDAARNHGLSPNCEAIGQYVQVIARRRRGSDVCRSLMNTMPWALFWSADASRNARDGPKVINALEGIIATFTGTPAWRYTFTSTRRSSHNPRTGGRRADMLANLVPDPATSAHAGAY